MSGRMRCYERESGNEEVGCIVEINEYIVLVIGWKGGS